MRVTIVIEGVERQIELTEERRTFAMSRTQDQLHALLDRAYKSAKQWIGEENV